MAGGIGIDANINNITEIPTNDYDDEILFSETEGRFLVTIRPEDKERFEKIFAGKYYTIGKVKGTELIIKDNATVLITKSVAEMLSMYHKGEA
jgi:phosphoribosylformylglycinamidine synthase